MLSGCYNVWLDVWLDRLLLYVSDHVNKGYVILFRLNGFCYPNDIKGLVRGFIHKLWVIY